MFDSLFGNGKMDILLPKISWRAGETIDGSLSFKLDEPLKARALIAGLRAKQRVRTKSLQQGREIVHDETKTLYEFKSELGGEKTYSAGSYDFRLVIPSDALGRGGSAPSGIIGDLARAAAFLSGETRSPVEWEVFAFIDIPWKMNVKKALAITVVEGAAPPPDPPPPTRFRIG